MPKVMLLTVVTLALAADLAPAAAQTGVALSAADRQGLAALIAADEEPVSLAGLDEAGLQRLALRYAVKESGQRLRPSSIDRIWALEPAGRDVPAEFAAAQQSGLLTVWLRSLSPADPGYKGLQAVRRRYAALAASGGWPALPAKTLKPGMRSDGVAALRQRLSIEGYLPAQPVADPRLYDEPLMAGVSAFQAAHGVTSDGVAGPATIATLNVSAEARLEQIDANLERLRWAPRDAPAGRVIVDTGLAEATLVRSGATVLTMRAVVGKRSTPTPMFTSRLESVVLNPPWNVPPTIATNEILPKAARDAGYLSREGFVRVAGGGLQQLPGPKNALGQIKFDLPSPFGVYLHDTPGRSAFASDQRHLSHGCMRLEKPRELAMALLGWPADQLSAAIDSGQTRRVAIPAPPALFVIHTTAYADTAGTAHFRSDVYGWDHKLAAALKGAGEERAEARPTETDCAVVGR